MSEFSSRSKRLLQNHDTLIQWVQHLLNAVIVVGILVSLTLWRDGFVGPHYRSMLVFAVLVMIITYHMFGVHRRFDTLIGGVQHLARAWGVVIIILAWVAFLTKTSEQYSRQVIVYWAVLSFTGQAVGQFLLYKAYKAYSTNYRERVPALIIGTDMVGRHLAISLKKNIWLRDVVVGVVGLNDSDKDAWDVKFIDFIGGVESLSEIVQANDIRRIYIAPTFAQNNCIPEILSTLQDRNLDIVWAPDIFEFSLLNHSVREVAGLPLITLTETPLMSGGPAFIKSMMDKSAALILILLISPILICVALAVKFSSKGPIIFKQVRDGWDGKKFHVYKFRSMYVHQPEKVIKQATKGDPRITPVGRFIRRTSLDELPQLFNILEGSMSLVGPRPHAESHNEFYSDKVKAYLARHRIKPGMTGLAQIRGFRGETETVEEMQGRVECDLEYISNWSPYLDIKILFMTPFALFSKNEKAY
jgi:putative colanic acid biosynthesis UDP-glucose lipid carrier transferase